MLEASIKIQKQNPFCKQTCLREHVALLILSRDCCRLFLAVPWICLQFVLVVFPDHTHFLVYTVGEVRISGKGYLAPFCMLFLTSKTKYMNFQTAPIFTIGSKIVN